MALPSALQSRIRVWVDGTEVVEAVDVSIDSPQPAGQKFGAAGMIGTYFGQAGSRISFTFAQVEGRSQFQTMVKKNQTAKVIVFTKGSERYIAQQAFWTDSGLRNAYESGDTSVTASVIAGTIEQVA